MSESLINEPLKAALASKTVELRKNHYPGCVMHNHNPCHCAGKIIDGVLHCGPRRDKAPISPAKAKKCERRTKH